MGRVPNSLVLKSANESISNSSNSKRNCHDKSFSHRKPTPLGVGIGAVALAAIFRFWKFSN